jgi:hypothetical protein
MKNTCYEIKGRLKVSAIKVRQSDRMIQMFIQHRSKHINNVKMNATEH